MFKKPASYRNKKTNTRYTKLLFWDNQVAMPIAGRSIEPLFTLHHDVKGYTNFRKEYLKDEDKTGYKTAMRLLEDYSHWQLLEKAPWFKEAKIIWDKELDAKLEAKALDVLKGIMKSDECKPSERISAAKEILKRAEGTSPRKMASSRKAGRPTSEEIEGNLKKETRESQQIKEDLARIRKVK